MTKALVIADTHNKLPPIICELARGADEIWHLGDMCEEWIVDELRALGPPLTLVRGNCDSNYEWPLVCNLTRNGIRFRLQHICPSSSQPPLDCDILLHGHTHVPRDETIATVGASEVVPQRPDLAVSWKAVRVRSAAAECVGIHVAGNDRVLKGHDRE